MLTDRMTTEEKETVEHCTKILNMSEIEVLGQGWDLGTVSLKFRSRKIGSYPIRNLYDISQSFKQFVKRCEGMTL